MHEGGDLAKLEDEFRSHGYLRDGVSVDLTALRAFLAPLAEPSRAESFRFSREWLRTETTQASALRSSSVLRRLNLPPSYLLIHRVLAAGLGVLCQLECEAPFRAEVLRWMPGYADTAKVAPQPQPACARSAPQPDPRRQPPQRARQVRAASHRQRARRIRAASQAAGAGKVHAASQSGAAGKDGAAGSACLASWARTANMVVRAVEGHHG